MITGNIAGTKTELWSRHSKGWTSCTLASLPNNQGYATLNGKKFCGGYKNINENLDTRVSSICMEYKQGAWVRSNDLTRPRYGHTSWKTDSGIYLMGGLNEDFEVETTTELVKEDGTVSTVTNINLENYAARFETLHPLVFVLKLIFWGRIEISKKFSSLGPKPLVHKPPRPNPNLVQPNSKPQSVQRGMRLE